MDTTDAAESRRVLARGLLLAATAPEATPEGVSRIGELVTPADVDHLHPVASEVWSVIVRGAADGMRPTPDWTAEQFRGRSGGTLGRILADLSDTRSTQPLAIAAREVMRYAAPLVAAEAHDAVGHAIRRGEPADGVAAARARLAAVMADLDHRVSVLEGGETADAGTFTGEALDAMELPPLRYVVPGLIPEGLSMLAGAPKLGKSWLVLAIALAVAAGGRVLGSIPVNPAPVLYLALEDGPRRLQSRARTLLGPGEPIPSGITFRTLGSHAAHERFIREWLTRHRENAPLVIIDTMGRYRPPIRGRGGYDDDYSFLAGVKAIIDDIPSGALLLVHHTRKSGAGEGGDWLDAATGTNGLVGAVDAALVLQRRRGESGALLGATGRDITRETVYALSTSGGSWTLNGGSLDAAAEAARTAATVDGTGDAMQQLVALVDQRAAAGEVTNAADVTRLIPALGKLDAARTYLNRAANAGRIGRAKTPGVFTASVSGVSGVSESA